jgi:hypothetical protein
MLTSVALLTILSRYGSSPFEDITSPTAILIIAGTVAVYFIVFGFSRVSIGIALVIALLANSLLGRFKANANIEEFYTELGLFAVVTGIYVFYKSLKK